MNRPKKILEEIAAKCEACQRFTVPPMRFKTSLQTEEELVFGDEISIDLMYIDNCAILHVVDTATRFSAATFLDKHGENYGQSVDGIWLALNACWVTLYTGYPNRLRTDQGSAFTSDRWREIIESKGIKIRLSGVRAHNSLGIGEKLHDPLRRIFRKIQHDFPEANPRMILSVAVKAMNDTINEKGLVPSRLVFGILPRFPILNSNLPNQKERLEIIKTAQAEMNSIVAERKIMTALSKNVPAAADRTYKLGEEILVYNENLKKWEGPYIVADCTGRNITVSNENGTYRRMFSTHQVKPYFRETFENLFNLKSGDNFNTETYSVMITEVIEPHDPRVWKFDEAKKKEIEGLLKRKTWKIVCREEVPDNANILRGRFILAIKDEGTDREIWKARFVVQGHRDKLKKLLVHDISVARQHSTKILIGIAAIFGFRLFSTDVTQAYLQSAENLKRDIFIDPPEEFNLKPDELIKLLKP